MSFLGEKIFQCCINQFIIVLSYMYMLRSLIEYYIYLSHYLMVIKQLQAMRMQYLDTIATFLMCVPKGMVLLRLLAYPQECVQLLEVFRLIFQLEFSMLIFSYLTFLSIILNYIYFIKMPLNDFCTVQINDEHYELLSRNKSRIIEFYRFPNDAELEIIQAEAKVIEGSGTYYKFLVKGSDGRSVYVKIDKLHHDGKCSDIDQWRQKYLNDS